MASDLAAGTTLAGYRIQNLVGRGGMGVVYRATQLSLEREVALKLIVPELAEQEAFRARFLREARIAASLEHPNVLPVHEAGEAEGVLYLAMRFVEGESLAAMLEREAPLSPARSIGLVTQIAEALEAAHEAGLVHRDVKPANVLVARPGAREHAYLCDFGLSRRTSGATELTKTGGFVGSVSYAAPEQIKGEPVDARTDIYALGCLLYECLTGEPPFRREHEAAVLWAHLNEPAPFPSALRPELGDAFDWVIDRALAKDPEERFPSADALVAAFLAEAPPPRRRPSRPEETSLPTPASSFLGRERELDEVGALLARPAELRLLTLTGPGGTGKTRLALRAAEQAAAHYRDGIHWAGLASLRDPALVTETIAQTLGAKDGLAEHISERELLLLLDNLEQVIEAAPALSALLSACPNLTLLVTSRELLRVSGEVEYAVPPLAAPEAIALFCERARLEPSEEIVELCARLDSLPLALELAAARTKALSPAQILERLAGRLDLLKGGRDADPRQQTLRATIEWSYDLLTAEEQQLFRRLSVFAGGCILEAAEEVCDADVDTLQSLVEKSLLRFADERYSMLETVREYAAEGLDESGTLASLKQRHCDFVRRLARQLEAAHWSDAERAKLHIEQANFREAVIWAETSGDVDAQLDLIGHTWRYWAHRGYLAEGRHWIRSALAHSEGQSSIPRAKVLAGAAFFALRLGEYDAMQMYAEESLEITRSLGDTRNAVWPLMLLGISELVVGNYDDSERLIGESIAVARGAGDQAFVGIALNNLGDAALRRGDFAHATRLFEESLEISRRFQTSDEVALETYNLALSLYQTGRSEDAVAAARESLVLASKIENPMSVADAFVLLAALAHRQGNSGVSPRLIGAAGVLRDRVGESVAGAEADLLAMTVEELLTTLGEEGYAQALAEGRAMSLDEAVAYALASVD